MRRPCSASATARLALSVDLPTPPCRSIRQAYLYARDCLTVMRLYLRHVFGLSIDVSLTIIVDRVCHGKVWVLAGEQNDGLVIAIATAGLYWMHQYKSDVSAMPRMATRHSSSELWKLFRGLIIPVCHAAQGRTDSRRDWRSTCRARIAQRAARLRAANHAQAGYRARAGGHWRCERGCRHWTFTGSLAQYG